MSLGSVLRYRNYLLREAAGKLNEGGKIALRMKRPIDGVVTLRERTSDFLTFEEIVDEEVYKEVSNHLRQCRTIIDLGSNIGLTSMYFATRYPKSKIFAVESNPDTYAMLKNNLKPLMDAARCDILHAAAWRAHEELAINQESGRYSVSSVRNPMPGENPGEVVTGMTIEEIIEHSGFDEIDLLKIDIEGAEAELFSGDRNWLRKVNAIAVEFHDDTRKRCNFDVVMKEFNFRIQAQDRHTVLAIKDGRLKT